MCEPQCSMSSTEDDSLIGDIEKFLTEEPKKLPVPVVQCNIVNTTSELLDILSSDDNMDDRRKYEKPTPRRQSATIKTVRFSVDETMLQNEKSRNVEKGNDVSTGIRINNRRRMSVESATSCRPKRVKSFDFMGQQNYAVLRPVPAIKLVVCKIMKEPPAKLKLKEKRLYNKKDFFIATVHIPDVRCDSYTVRNIVVKKEVIDLTKESSFYYSRLNFASKHFLEEVKWETNNMLFACAEEIIEGVYLRRVAITPAPNIHQHQFPEKVIDAEHLKRVPITPVLSTHQHQVLENVVDAEYLERVTIPPAPSIYQHLFFENVVDAEYLKRTAITSALSTYQHHVPEDVIDLTDDVNEVTHKECASRIIDPMLKYCRYYALHQKAYDYIKCAQTCLTAEDFENESRYMLLLTNNRLALLGKELIEQLTEIEVRNVDVREIFRYVHKYLKEHHNVDMPVDHLCTFADEMLKKAGEVTRPKFVEIFASQLSEVVTEANGIFSQEQLNQLIYQIQMYHKIDDRQMQLRSEPHWPNSNFDGIKEEMQTQRYFDDNSGMPNSDTCNSDHMAMPLETPIVKSET